MFHPASVAQSLCTYQAMHELCNENGICALNGINSM